MTRAASRRSSRLGTIRETRAGSASAPLLAPRRSRAGSRSEPGADGARSHLPERLEHRIRHLPGSQDLPLPLGDRAHRTRLVMTSCTVPMFLPIAPRGSGRRSEEPAKSAHSVGQPGRRVVHTRSRNHEGHPRCSRNAGITIGHERRGLLVPGRDHPDSRLVAQRRHDPVDLYAGMPNTTSTPSFTRDFTSASPPLIVTIGAPQPAFRPDRTVSPEELTTNRGVQSNAVLEVLQPSERHGADYNTARRDEQNKEARGESWPMPRGADVASTPADAWTSDVMGTTPTPSGRSNAYPAGDHDHPERRSLRGAKAARICPSTILGR